ncbi:SUF system Fe-S cluster assembly regulator [Sandaracinobacteroides sp. A072]|uniref:SUF system Fe-S cluster assembly regulator n=1 Tax=Sandaracinobacteroides sp. A072 TaxID=3461146 RepID=UPI004042C2F3
MLRLSNLADYGVLVMTTAARATETGGLTSASQIAGLSAIPAPTVAKLLGQLARAGLLTSQRGVAGGFALARPARSISLADIVEAIDGPIALTHCGTPGADCDLSGHCTVRPHWAPVNAAVRAALSAVSLADIAPEAHGAPHPVSAQRLPSQAPADRRSNPEAIA